jgi:hypothetical protein
MILVDAGVLRRNKKAQATRSCDAVARVGVDDAASAAGFFHHANRESPRDAMDGHKASFLLDGCHGLVPWHQKLESASL